MNHIQMVSSALRASLVAGQEAGLPIHMPIHIETLIGHAPFEPKPTFALDADATADKGRVVISTDDGAFTAYWAVSRPEGNTRLDYVVSAMHGADDAFTIAECEAMARREPVRGLELQGMGVEASMQVGDDGPVRTIHLTGDAEADKAIIERALNEALGAADTVQ